MLNYKEIIEFDNLKNIGITGLTDAFFAVYLSNLYYQKKNNIVVVTDSLYEANKIYNEVSNFVDNVYLFPMDDFLTSEAIAISPDLLINRMETIKSITSNNKNSIIITNLMGYLRYLPSKQTYLENVLDIKVNDTLSPSILYEKLVRQGYKSETLVTTTGEVGLRGFVIDVFPLGEEYPIRFEFFGDEIDEIKYFDPSTQKSIKNIDEVTIYPNSEFLTINANIEDEEEGKQKYLPKYEKPINILGYLNDSYVIYKNYSLLQNSYESILKEIEEYKETKDTNFDGNYMFSLDELTNSDAIYYMNVNNLSTKKLNKVINYNVHTLNNFYEKVDAINLFIDNAIKENKTIVICLKDYQIRSIIKKLNIDYIITTFDKIKKSTVNIVESSLDEGFIYNDLVFITAKELFLNNKSSRKYKTNFKYSTKITDINKIQIGDYVVHIIHGIGIYNGIKNLTVNGVEKDYIEVIYQGSDKLYIPVEKIDSLYKYTGKDGSVPKINKLSNNDFLKTKTRINKKVQEMADSLIKLYAERESRKGFSFSKDTDLQIMFEKDFPYTLTKDQIHAIQQIKQDMEDSKPMDRLLCGDVGFGKTEVAFVSAFKAISDSKQVLLLCPTTILSNQHYKNALVRFQNYPVNIKLFNRFTTTKEKNEIIKGLQDGTIDMVIGTHRLLNDAIKPKDLGLLIIDEEQRFGVKHKEKIKEYKTNVDVLTLTATPIPRTLQMSMTGIRSLSLIETPPVDRYPVQTYVVSYNKQIIKDAIYKELSRNGQVFLLYNSVENIEKKVYEIKELVPEARIIYAHGRMNKQDLEDRMLAFINHEYDVLICTTIIETGIDIPNVNTLIILDADRFGLSQLYQIRGRVGRSNKFSYAYLMYDDRKTLTETAIKRLNVIKEFTELGSGFSIAARDLSIRGAGDILGSEQAGFIDSVGIDLYLKLLNNEINRRKGIDIEEEQEDKTNPLINVNTHIKDSYVDNEDLKIEIHRKINTIDSKETFEAVKNELEDRFGTIDEDMIIYMYEEWFEKLAKKAKIVNVRETKNFIELVFSKDSAKEINIEKIFTESFKISPMFRFQARGNTIVIILDTIKLEKHPIYYLIPFIQLWLDEKID